MSADVIGLAARLADCNGGPVPGDLKAEYVGLSFVDRAYVGHHLEEDHRGVLTQLVAAARDAQADERSELLDGIAAAADPATAEAFQRLSDLPKACTKCQSPLPKGRRRYCSDECAWQARSEKAESERGPSTATCLVELADERWRMAQGDDGGPYAVPYEGTRVARPLRGRSGVRQALASAWYEAHGAAVAAQALADACAVLEGRAMAAGRETFPLRVAAADGAVYLDLGWPNGSPSKSPPPAGLSRMSRRSCGAAPS